MFSSYVLRIQYYLESNVSCCSEGLMFLVDLFETSTAFKKYNTSINYIPTKGCTNGIPFKSRKYWVCHVRRTVEGGYHPSGTCRMGKDTGDPMAVLDSKLRFVRVKISRSIFIFKIFN